MSVGSTTNRVSYTGNGSTNVYDYTFRIFSEDDLRVVVKNTSDVETVLTKTTDYTVSGVGIGSGGEITLVDASQAWLTGGNLTTGYVITIRRVLELTQETDIRNQGDFFPEEHENQFDRQVMISQQQQDAIDRSIKLAESINPANFDATIPASLEGQAGVTIITNPSGDGFIAGPTADQISSASGDAAAAEASADLAEEWATKVNGQVESVDYSAKAWAIGGTGVTDTASRGAAKEWAIETSSTVDGTDYSAKEWAKGTQTRGVASGGSAKDWANYTGGTVDDTEYSAKKYAADAALSAAEAAAAAASSQWDDVSFKTFADSPITISDADSGTLFDIDCTGGNVVVNLAEISTLDLSSAWSVGFKKSDSSSNTITINSGGSDTIDGNATKVLSRQYSGSTLVPDIDPSPDRWTSLSYGEVPVAGAIVGTSDAQVLTNKTFDDPLTIKEVATPSTPASGYGKVYFKSDGKLYQMGDNGIESQVGSGSGSGGINYVSDGDAENQSASLYVLYDDGSVSRPVDGTGGSPAGVAFAVTTTNPLRDNAAYTFSKDAASRQGMGFGRDFEIDPADKAKVLTIKTEYIINSGSFSAGSNSADSDLIFYIYDVTNSRLIEPSSIKLFSNSSTISDVFEAQFQSSSDSVNYRLIGHIATTNASAWEIKFDNFSVGPSQYVYGTPITDWQSFTPTGSWVSNTTYTGFYRRVGDKAEIKYNLAITGTPTTAALTVNMPTGLTIDTAKLPSAVAGFTVLSTQGNLRDTGTINIGLGVMYSSTSAFAIYSSAANNTYTSFPDAVTQASPFTFANTDTIQFEVAVPITGWSSSVQMSDRADTRVVAATGGPTTLSSISALSTAKLTWGSPTLDTHSAWNTSLNRYVIQVAGWYRTTVSTGGNQIYFLLVYKNGSQFRGGSYPAANNIWPNTNTAYYEAGDYIEFFITNNSGSTFTVNSDGRFSYWSIERVQGPSAIAATETVAFSANTSTTAASSATPLIFTNVLYNSHGWYNSANGRFTVQAPGSYQFNWIGYFGATATDVNIHKNGTKIGQGSSTTSATTGIGAITLPMIAGDYVDIRPGNPATAAGSAGLNTFSGFRIG